MWNASKKHIPLILTPYNVVGGTNFYARREIKDLLAYLKTIDNLYCVGRNGQHRYNNIDHSMVTSFETVRNIVNGIENKDNIWNVNTEKEYHES